MVFTLMWIMAILMGLINVIVLGFVIYKKGDLFKNKYCFAPAVSALILEIWIGVTSLPSNYYHMKLIYFGILITLLASVFFHKKDFNKSRYALGLTSILTNFVFFFL